MKNSFWKVNLLMKISFLILLFNCISLPVLSNQNDTDLVIKETKEPTTLDATSEETQVEKAIPEVRDLKDNANNLQEGLSKTVFNLANTLDSFFGEKRADDESNKSTLRLVHSFYNSESGHHDSESELRLNLRLQNLEEIGERWQQQFVEFLGQADDKIEGQFESSTVGGTVGSSSDGVKGSTDMKSKSRARAAIKKWNINWENRVGYRKSIDLFSTLRARRNFQGSLFTHRFYQEMGWSTVNEWQAVTSYNSDLELNKDWLFRWVNEFNWQMTNRQFSTSHGPSFYQHIDNSNSISYNARFLSAVVGSALYGDGYNVGLSYRRQFSLKWLFMEITPQAAFPRVQNFRRDLNLNIQLEAVFGNL